MAYNAQLYSNQLNNGQMMYPMPMQSSMPITPQSIYPQLTAPPLSLSAAYTQGEIGARSYPVAAGNTVILIDSDTSDSDNPILYIKTTGYDGKPQTMKKISGVVSYPNEQGLFTASVQSTSVPEVDLSNYITKDDLSDLDLKVSNITERINSTEEIVNKLNDTISNIEEKFSNIFNVANSSNNNPNYKNNHNNNRKGNKFDE